MGVWSSATEIGGGRTASMLAVRAMLVVLFVALRGIDKLAHSSEPSAFQMLQTAQGFVLRLATHSGGMGAFLLGLPAGDQERRVGRFVFRAVAKDHFREFVRLLAAAVPVGRRLDLRGPQWAIV